MKIRLAAFFYVFSFFFANCYSEVIEKFISHKTPVFISLGEGCKTAAYLRHSNIRSSAYPFDWMLSHNFESIYRIFFRNFDGYMDFNNLINTNFYDHKMQKIPREIDGLPQGVQNLSMLWVLDSFYGIESRHDFSNNLPLEAEYEEVMKKIRRRIDRLYKTLNRTDVIVFFVRLMVTREQAIKFRNLIESKFPNLFFIFLALSNSEDCRWSWNERSIRNFYFDDPVYQWNVSLNSFVYNNGNSIQAWDEIIKKTGI